MKKLQLAIQALKAFKTILLNSSKKAKIVFISIATIFLLYLTSFNYIPMNELTLNHNIFSGEVECDTVSGIKLSAPWIQVAVIDRRPIRVCIDCSCRNLTCKLVEFDPKGYKDFIQKEGWSYYWFRNRLSFNSGNNQEYRGINNIIRGYAFDDKKYTFLKYHQL